jgi:GSH-dependent disulfide-bond oxidoreductase
MIDLNYRPTPNGHKIMMFLEEIAMPFTIVPYAIER